MASEIVAQGPLGTDAEADCHRLRRRCWEVYSFCSPQSLNQEDHEVPI